MWWATTHFFEPSAGGVCWGCWDEVEVVEVEVELEVVELDEVVVEVEVDEVVVVRVRADAGHPATRPVEPLGLGEGVQSDAAAEARFLAHVDGLSDKDFADAEEPLRAVRCPLVPRGSFQVIDV